MTGGLDLPGSSVATADWPGELRQRIAADFGRLGQAWATLDAALLTPPSPDSSCAAETVEEYAARAHDVAPASLRSALDHHVTWKILAERTRFRPTYAHFSLIRAAHESSWMAYWLLEPGTGAADRLARGVAAQYADYDERRKFEHAMGRPELQPPSRSAADRLQDLLTAATARGLTRVNKNRRTVLAKPLPSAVELFDLYEPTGPELKGSFLYRLLSGCAHGKQWAVVQGIRAVGPVDENGRTLGQVHGNPRWAVAATPRAVSAFVKGVNVIAASRRSAPLISDAT